MDGIINQGNQTPIFFKHMHHPNINLRRVYFEKGKKEMVALDEKREILKYVGDTSQLFGVKALDSEMFGIGVAVILAVSFSAASLPAWRASRINPNRALRWE